ncbi:tyrosine-type recombinase/integrase [Draconibacterium orientale]|uniref:tyrosine-type recombinase/integrase n=1 Tax=Draconibacterium orientale TaxID=1168034 RepID=UPI002ABDF3E3|nr:tyrosine-type recombinase/integrase [Draconibacterium orientale]
MEASVKIVLERHRTNTEGLCAVKIRITHNRKSKYYSIKHLLKEDAWNFCPDTYRRVKKKGKYEMVHELDYIKAATKGAPVDIKLNYEAIERKAKDYINELPVFSFEKFEVKFMNKPTNWDYLHHAFMEHIQELESENRLGYASSFNGTLTGIKYFMEKKPYKDSKNIKQKDHVNFTKYKSLKFVDITPGWLKKYEQFLKNNGKSTSTIGIHSRNLRVLFNKALKGHGIKAIYPFGEYKPKTSENSKKALTIDQVNAIASHNASFGTPEHFAKDMFLFSFLANGMNMTDIFRLKKKNITSEEIQFVRYKTKNKKKEVEINVALTPILNRIIKQHGNLAINKDVYVFPVLNGAKDEDDAYRLIKQKTKQINYHIKAIAKKVGIPADLASSVSTYHARHSYATILKNSGESIEYIKESLGHSSSATTEKYLKSFGGEHRLKTALKLDRQIQA